MNIKREITTLDLYEEHTRRVVVGGIMINVIKENISTFDCIRALKPFYLDTAMDELTEAVFKGLRKIKNDIREKSNDVK